jgi:hypothetical protein
MQEIHFPGNRSFFQNLENRFTGDNIYGQRSGLEKDPEMILIRVIMALIDKFLINVPDQSGKYFIVCTCQDRKPRKDELTGLNNVIRIPVVMILCCRPLAATLHSRPANFYQMEHAG